VSHRTARGSPRGGARSPARETATPVRILLTAGVVLAAAGAAAEEPYAPPHMSFGPPAQGAPAAPAPAPAAVPEPLPYTPPGMSFGPPAAPPAPESPPGLDPSAATTVVPRFGLGLGFLAGRFTEPGAPGARFGLGLEALLLADLGRFVAGGLATLGGVGTGLSAAGGARLPVTPALRVDLLADLGFGIGSNPLDSAVRPVAGARAGLTWVRAGGRNLTLGVGLRHAFPKDAAVPDPACTSYAGPCPTVPGKAYGATIAGGFLTWGGAPDARR